jgi:hypothetical protein
MDTAAHSYAGIDCSSAVGASCLLCVVFVKVNVR